MSRLTSWSRNSESRQLRLGETWTSWNGLAKPGELMVGRYSPCLRVTKIRSSNA